MKKGLLFFIACITLAACADDNFIRLEVNPNISSLVPDYAQTKRFASNEGDTIELRKISSDNYYEKISADIGNLGALGQTDYIEAQRMHLVIGCDTPYLRFYFNTQAIYSAESQRLSSDKLELTFADINGPADARLTFTYTDTLICTSERCAFGDTLKLLDKSFFDAYFTSRDSISRKALYLNARKGLVGFRGDNNKIFELID